jgi:3-hydroxy-9,10-secoandrosta-1,3,5(10)-triene-9,17-dione monooxygenase
MSAQARQVAGRDELVRRAAQLVPRLAERALQTERLRRIPEESVRDLVDAGLLRIATPDRFGGYGLDYDAALEVGAELSRGCGSTGWCYMVWSSHNWLLGHYAEQAQEEYFAATADVLSSSAFNAGQGHAELADGGYLLSGQWSFSSGCDEGTWALLAAVTPDQGPGLFLVPRADYAIEDTWFVSGLQGTGSKDVVMATPTFVPRHRFLSYQAMGTVQTPGRPLHNRASYRLPVFSIMPFTLAAPLLGIAQGAVAGFEERTRTRIAQLSGLPVANAVGVQLRLAESSAEVDCARLLMRHDLDEMLALGAREEPVEMGTRLRYRRDHAYIAKLAVQSVNRLFDASGGNALFESSAIQRAHRDVHAGSHQAALTWDTYAEQYGRGRLGLEPTDTIL